MSIIQNSIKYNKPFIMIVSCYQNLETRITQIYHLWLKYCKYPFKIIIGRETQEHDYSVEGDIIYLKCKDNYDFLPYKIKLGMKVINHLYDYDYDYGYELFIVYMPFTFAYCKKNANVTTQLN